MLHNKAYVKKTKGGKVMKQVREHYLRDDIYCGAPFCTVCDSYGARLSASPSTILVLDTNVVLNQIDLLENPAIDDVVVLSIVLEEVKNKAMSVYNRLRAICSNSTRKFFVFSNEYHRKTTAVAASTSISCDSIRWCEDTYVKQMSGETPNDRNDRAIRVATQWYQKHLGGAVKVLLVTNDKENKRKACEEGICAETVESYVKSLDRPDLLDLLVRPSSEDVDMVEDEDDRPSKRKVIYSEHKPMSEITSGLHRGVYHQGKLRVNRYNPFEAYVGSESIGDEIIIYGRSNMNRAFDGDIVAVELLPQDQWQGEKSLSIAGEEDEDEDEEVHLAPNSSDVAPRTIPQQGSSGDISTGPNRPSGRIVGIIKRNWHSLRHSQGCCAFKCLVSISNFYCDSGGGGGCRDLLVYKVGGEGCWPGGDDYSDGGGGECLLEKPMEGAAGSGGYCGSLEPMSISGGSRGVAYPLFVSKDRRFPKIRIQTRQLENLLDKRIIVSVDSWDRQSRYPSGHYVRTIGDIGDRDTESEVVLIENDINSKPFSAQVLACLPPLPWSVSSEDLSIPFRQDLRHLRVFSVDPPDIADVTNFVFPGTPLDDEASQRGTSVYLVERRIDMLPKPLTEGNII
ncbi:hypothetical protein TSUD_185770 [Trifolium subterraneum]|uniref:PIN domain-containing protein n=1 Tax=Trifolium subterraneum TaxID=3900 RepID=A0A2Z6PDH3_TRISU|nr:hypothetical protein TSUD_185770 [Trifolium subterraneum]